MIELRNFSLRLPPRDLPVDYTQPKETGAGAGSPLIPRTLQ